MGKGQEDKIVADPDLTGFDFCDSLPSVKEKDSNEMKLDSVLVANNSARRPREEPVHPSG